MRPELLLFRLLAALVVSISTWLEPQPKLSEGLLVNYGSRQIVRANAEWHGYSLPDDCGLASIGASHLGQLAWISVDKRNWIGPCRVVDVVARIHFYDSVFVRKEVAEIPRWMANELGFEYGHHGFIWFGACKPDKDEPAEFYIPNLEFDFPPTDYTPSLYPYPEEKRVVDCDAVPSNYVAQE